jgi:glycosyltransferase involved in cell wall biosynthesis
VKAPQVAIRPRVLVYTDSVAVGGADISLGRLIRALGDRVDASVLATDPEVAAWLARECPDTPVHRIGPVRGKRDLAGIARHVREFRHRRPQIVQVNASTPWEGQYGILAGLVTRGARVVVLEHTPEAPGQPLQRRLRRLANAWLSAHVATTDYSARAIEQATRQRRGSVLTIRSGVPDVQLVPHARLRSEPTVGFLGRLDPQKGVDVLLRALSGLPGAAAVIVGNGSQRHRLAHLAEELGLSQRVVMTGHRQEARSMLPTFDVVAVPSRWEAFGLVTVEAMLAERPVVASAVGGIPEVVADRETGFLVPPEDPDALADALRKLLADPDLRARMGRRGREIALERYHPDVTRDGFLALYARLLG